VTLAEFGYPVFEPLVLLLPKLLIIWICNLSKFERTWWLLQKRTVRTKLYIYVYNRQNITSET